MTNPLDLRLLNSLQVRLSKWQKRDAKLGFSGWYNLADLRRGFGEKSESREALKELERQGLAFRRVFSSGEFWQAAQ